MNDFTKVFCAIFPCIYPHQQYKLFALTLLSRLISSLRQLFNIVENSVGRYIVYINHNSQMEFVT